MTTLVRVHRTPVAVVRPRPHVGRWDSVLVAVLATAVSAAGAARPSLWFDEAATLSAAQRSVPELWRTVLNIDAVHGLYYLLMRGWFAVFPATEFAARLSSALCVGAAAAGVVVLGRQVSGRSVAITAGVLFAVLPRVTWAGAETRSYALTMVAAVWLTILCLVALRRGGWSWWSGYAVAAAAAAVLNVFLVLMLPVHAVAAAVWPRARRSGRHWMVAATMAAGLAAPVLVFAQTQLFQVRWISPLSRETVGEILQEQYFDHAVPFALLAAVMLGCGLLCVDQVGAAAGRQPLRLVVLTVCWMTIPTIALLAYSTLHNPVYYPRYLSFTAPAMALLLGLCVVAVWRSRSAVTGMVVLFTVAAAPNYLAQRGPYAKERMDYSAVADVIDANAVPGDCLVLDNSVAWMPGPIRPLTAARPEVYAKLHDYGRARTAVERNRLWDSHGAVWAWADKMPACPALWTVTERDPAVPDHERGPQLDPGPRLGRAMAYQVPGRLGFRVVERWQFSFAQVTKSVRAN